MNSNPWFSDFLKVELKLSQWGRSLCNEEDLYAVRKISMQHFQFRAEFLNGEHQILEILSPKRTSSRIPEIVLRAKELVRFSFLLSSLSLTLFCSPSKYSASQLAIWAKLWAKRGWVPFWQKRLPCLRVSTQENRSRRKLCSSITGSRASEVWACGLSNLEDMRAVTRWKRKLANDSFWSTIFQNVNLCKFENLAITVRWHSSSSQKFQFKLYRYRASNNLRN